MSAKDNWWLDLKLSLPSVGLRKRNFNSSAEATDDVSASAIPAAVKAKA